MTAVTSLTKKPFPWQFLRRAILPVIGLVLIGVAAVTISRPPSKIDEPRIAPPTPSAAKEDVVAALGIIEPSSEIIGLVGDVAGIVVEVMVTPGQVVAAGTPLLRIDPRSAGAALEERVAAVESARADTLTRQGDITASEAAVTRSIANAKALEAGVAQSQAAASAAGQSADRARVALADAQARFSLFTNVRDKEAISRDELDRARFAVEQARVALAEASATKEQSSAATRVARAQADAALSSISEARAVRDRTRAGMAGDAANIRQAQAQVRTGAVDLDRLIIRAPIAGTILRVAIKPGEFAPAGGTALIQMGQTNPLHVRVDIDEEDAQRVSANARAEGSLRSDATKKIALTFVRFEPLATPKLNLAGGSARVDTRVVEAVFALDPSTSGFDVGQIFIGQQMDVFIAARPSNPADVAPTPPASQAPK